MGANFLKKCDYIKITYNTPELVFETIEREAKCPLVHSANIAKKNTSISGISGDLERSIGLNTLVEKKL